MELLAKLVGMVIMAKMDKMVQMDNLIILIKMISELLIINNLLLNMAKTVQKVRKEVMAVTEVREELVEIMVL